jgi:hypothetical protein
MYALIQATDDGTSITLLDERKLNELLTNPREFAGVEEFKNGAWFGANQDANYWREGIGVLVTLEVVVPRPVTTAYAID